MYRLTVFILLLTFGYSQCDSENWQEFAPNLDGCELSGATLVAQDFSYYSFDGADLSSANVGDSDFSHASMVNANLSDTYVGGAMFEQAFMCGVDLSLVLGNYSGTPITLFDCFDVCGGSSELDECGVCDGDGTACFGCMDPFATNYSELAIYDDGSCEYFEGEISNEAPPLIWTSYMYTEEWLIGNDSESPDYNGGWNLEEGSISCTDSFNGGIICAATYYSHGYSNPDDTDCSGAGNNLTIIVYEYDLTGELVWFREFGSYNHNGGPGDCGAEVRVHDLIKTNDNFYILVGQSTAGAWTYDDGRYTNALVIKFDINGNLNFSMFIDDWDDLDNSTNNDFWSNSDFNSALITDTGDLLVVGVSELELLGYCGTIRFIDSIDGVQTSFIPFCGLDSNDDRFYDVIKLSSGEYLAVGESYSNDNYYPLFVKFSEDGILEYNILEDLPSNFENPRNFGTMIELDNGNILYGGSLSSSWAFILQVDQNLELVSYAFDHHTWDLGTGSSAITDIIKTNDGDLIVTGWTEDGFNAYESMLIKMDQNMNIAWMEIYGGGVFSSGDHGSDTIQMPDNRLFTSSYHRVPEDSDNVLNLTARHYESGCMDLFGCNYNPIASYDDGSCYFEDICDVCDGNDYDFCDDDGDGVNNYDQWGYGAYNLSLSDIPNDQGGRVYISFDNSYFDSDTLQSRSETYTIERKDGDNWVVAQSFGAYGADSYTVEVTTLGNNMDNEFRVIASMDEGNFLSYDTVTGQSLDNIAPGAPGTLLGEFEGGEVTLSWEESLDSDFMNFNVYRQSELYATTAESTFADSDLPNIPLLGYSVSAVDVNGNESLMSDVDVLIYIDGDLNEDYELNVLDVVLMVEHIMGYELEDTEYADINNDGAVDILDVVMLVGIILNENRSDDE